MTRQEQLTQWLGDRQRKYADGIVLFEALAKEPAKKRFSAYFAKSSRSSTYLRSTFYTTRQ